MIREKKTLEASDLSRAWVFRQPSSPVLVTTTNPDGGVNVAPFGWNMPVSGTPPRLVLALLDTPQHRQTSLINLERTGEFVVNVPDLDVAEKLVASAFLYPKDAGKLQHVGFQSQPSLGVSTPGIGECRASLECRLWKTVPAGDHTLVIGDIVAVQYDPLAYTEDLLLRVDRCTPVLHLEQYHRESGQLHLFLVPRETRVVDLRYPPVNLSEFEGLRMPQNVLRAERTTALGEQQGIEAEGEGGD